MVHIRIDELLKEQNKTRYWLIKQTELSFDTVTKLANGEKQAIRFDTLEKICLTLKCSPNDIIDFD